MVLFAPALDDMIAPDDSLRVLDAVFQDLDWSMYERAYHGGLGQPAIHPRYIAGAIFLGILKGLRGSRRIEDATRMRVDFMWLLQGQTIDHSTICKFRKQFKEPLRDTFRQVNRKGLERLGERLIGLVVDGTRVRACSDRQGARTADWLERRMAELERLTEEALEQMAREDLATDPSEASVRELEERLEDLEHQHRCFEEALAVARKRDSVKREKEGKDAAAVRVPLNDPDASVLPNKEGGYAPNYTPVAGVDEATGLILAADVLPDGAEATAVLPLVEQVRQDHGQAPDRVIVDGNFASGANQAALEQAAILLYAPAGAPAPEGHPAGRQDLSQPLPPERLRNLPRVRRTGKFQGDAFVFDPQHDCYWCPLGRALPTFRTLHRKTRDGRVQYNEYRCPDCSGCPLAGDCLSRGATRRHISRDLYEEARENTARRMATPEGKEIYRRRAPVVEGTFGTIKAAMGVRNFLLRSLSGVRTEWLWICTAYNLRKLVQLLMDPVQA